MPIHVLNNLSSDQQLLWAFTKGPIVGHVEESYISRKIGPMYYARWLRLATRILSL